MRISIVLLIAVMSASACEKKPAGSAPLEAPKLTADVGVSALDVSPPPKLAGPTDVGKTLLRLDARIAFHRKRGEAKGGWLHYESLAGTYLARARLTGSIDDYVAAGAAIDKAFEIAKAGSGPFFTRAHYNFTIHRNALVEADVANTEKKVILTVEDKERAAGLRGDLALHRADLVKAREYYESALALRHTLANVSRIAFLDLKTGNLDAARKGYEEAAELAKSDKATLAWAWLQRGIVELEAGDPKSALEWYEKANETFTGWVLVEEHIAEAQLQLGDADGAAQRYESIVARSPTGEFMGALSDCWAAKGDAEKQKQWVEKARVAFEADIAKLPSAASGHALEFFLRHDTRRALELAKQNVKLRPNHEARMQLAQAYLATGKPGSARTALGPVVGSAWAAPDFLATVAIAFEGVDDKVAAQAASKVDPNVVSELRARLGLT